MNQSDEKLRDLLRRWSDIEPPGNFEANVWCRIRATATRPQPVTLAELLWRRMIWQPALATAAALMVGVIIGSSAGVFTASPPARPQHAAFSFLAGDTLAGGYFHLSSQVKR
jgi:hypothetical protein